MRPAASPFPAAGPPLPPPSWNPFPPPEQRRYFAYVLLR